jgi:hypothetical protein
MSNEMTHAKVLGTFFFSNQLLSGVNKTAKKPPINKGTNKLLPTIKKNTNTMMKTKTERALRYAGILKVLFCISLFLSINFLNISKNFVNS